MDNYLILLGNEFLNSDLQPIKYEINNIKEEKIICLFFNSYFHPYFTEINNKIINFSKEFQSKLQFIYIPCDENDEEISLNLQNFKNFPGLIINSNKIKEKIFLKFSINTIPYLMIFDKKGHILDTLNKNLIINLNSSYVNKWVNLIEFPIKYKTMEISLGDKAKLSCHPHILVYSDYTLKDPSYHNCTWYCDICRGHHAKTDKNFYCGLCGFDLCDKCYKTYKES